MIEPQHVLSKRKEIYELFAEHGDFHVRIVGSANPAYPDRAPDAEILLNLDENKDEDIVVLVGQDSQVLVQIRAIKRHDFAMDVLLRLRALLNCSVNVVDEGGLRHGYPVTHSALRRK
ncbi:MAG: hypothetical protein JSS83_13425 [Cyanobacteria bacterium SZAS LIN-3]|nr:hypothetical protein [Cyanobacteria bacterium SZAS LIN-3]